MTEATAVVGKRMAIPVNEETHALYRQLADLTGMQMREIAHEAAQLWMKNKRTMLRAQMERRIKELDALAGEEPETKPSNGRKRRSNGE